MAELLLYCGDNPPRFSVVLEDDAPSWGREDLTAPYFLAVRVRGLARHEAAFVLERDERMRNVYAVDPARLPPAERGVVQACMTCGVRKGRSYRVPRPAAARFIDLSEQQFRGAIIRRSYALEGVR